jgi:hypothetical protein
MTTRFLVREIRFKPGCWPLQAVDPAALNLVCPLCVLDGRAMAKTAVLQHYIRCEHEQCGRMSAIYAPDGLMALFPLAGSSLLTKLDGAMALVRSALQGDGPLLTDILELDGNRPVIVMSSRVTPIKLSPLGGVEIPPGVRSREEDSEMPLGGVPRSILQLLATTSRPIAKGRTYAPVDSPAKR